MKKVVTIILLAASGFRLASPISEQGYMYGRTPLTTKNLSGKPAKKITLPPSDERDVHAVYKVLTQVTECKQFE